MHTTLDIDDDLLAAAKALPRQQGVPAGQAVSRLLHWRWLAVVRHRGRFVTFDGRVQPAAVAGARPEHLVVLTAQRLPTPAATPAATRASTQPLTPAAAS